MESINLRGNAIDDPQTSQAFMATLQSLLVDMKAIQTWANNHQHAALNAAPTTTVGNFNTGV